MKQYALKSFAFMLLSTYSESPHYVQYMPQASIHSCVLCCILSAPVNGTK